MFSRPKMAFKVQIIEWKDTKRILKWIFEVERVVKQKNLESKRSGSPKLCRAD